MDSFQLSHVPGAKSQGVIYFDELRAVQKESVPVKVETIADQQPDRFELMQNYPNPFNHTTTIPFQIASSSNVRLVVYNSLGQQVQVLLDHSLAAGSHRVVFDASTLASGLYYYQLWTDSGQMSRRFQYLK